VASFRVISADSHPVAGVIRFVVGNGVLMGGKPTSGTVNHLVSTILNVARWLSFGGLAVLAGMWLIVTAWEEGRSDLRTRLIVWSGLVTLAFGTVVELLMQGPYTAGSALTSIANWSLLDGTLHTSYGRYHSARLLILGLMAFLLGYSLQAKH